MDASILSYHIETWVFVGVGLVCGGFLLLAYIRSRIPSLLYLAIGNALYLAYSFCAYAVSLSDARLSPGGQLALTGLFLLASIITTVGMLSLRTAFRMCRI